MDLVKEYQDKEMVKDFVKNLRNQKPETMIPLTDEEIETIKDLVVNEFENIMSDLDGNYITFEKCLDELRPILNLERKLRVI